MTVTCHNYPGADAALRDYACVSCGEGPCPQTVLEGLLIKITKMAFAVDASGVALNQYEWGMTDVTSEFTDQERSVWLRCLNI